MLCPNHELEGRIASKSIGYCSMCLGSDDSAIQAAKDRHKQLRFNQNLVPNIPESGSIVCPDCGNHLTEALPCRVQDDGAIFHTGAASGAAIFDDGAGAFFDLDLEIPGRAFHAFKVRIGDQFDIQMPADLDQFR